MKFPIFGAVGATALALVCAAALAQTPAPAPVPGAPAPTAPAPAAPAPTAPAPAAPPAPPAASTAPDESSSVVTANVESKPALVAPGSAQWEDGFTAIMAAVAKLKAAAAKAGLAPVGHPVAAFVETDDSGFKFEAMLPLQAAPDPKADFGSGLRAGQTPAGKALKFHHGGAYDEIDTTYEAITAYLDEKGLEATNVFIEEYLNDPIPTKSDDTQTSIDIYVFIK